MQATVAANNRTGSESEADRSWTRFAL
jgi:hypothetical protein